MIYIDPIQVKLDLLAGVISQEEAIELLIHAIVAQEQFNLRCKHCPIFRKEREKFTRANSGIL